MVPRGLFMLSRRLPKDFCGSGRWRASVAGPRYVIWTLEVCLILALACSCSAALDSNRTIAQFAHTAWGPKDGAPGVVSALAQSTDGYLWLGSPEGLYRFDGLVFEHYQPQSGGSFPAQAVYSLLALPNGDLWIGFSSGAISLLRNGNATNYTVREGVPKGGIWGLAQDRKRTIWAATNSGGKIGVSQESLPSQFFWIAKEHFGFRPRTRWFFFHRAPGGFSRRVFEWAR